MADSRIAWNNLTTASGVVIAASAEVTDRPASYLASPQRWKKWRSTTTTGDQWVTFDLGSNQAMTAILLADWLAHTTGGTITVQANATDSWGAPTVDETLTLPSPNATKVIGVYFASQSLRWVRVYFTNVGAVSEFVELGVAFAGTYIQPTLSIAPGFDLRRVDPAVITMSDDGQESAQTRTKFYQLRGSFNFATDAERDTFSVMTEAVGISTPVFLAVDPNDMDLTFYGRFTEGLVSRPPKTATLRWHLPFTFREVR